MMNPIAACWKNIVDSKFFYWRVGFAEWIYKYDVFRRELGITRSEYRKQRQMENTT